ncbi:MAG: MoaD/ThiS family protein [Chloroflexi bacterium]|nr:MoaD/ThiS family protein [Chloroflexota bacterium]
MINVRLYTTLRKHWDNADVNLPIQVEFEPEMTIARLATKLGVGETEVMLAAVNNQIAGHNQLVQDGDEVSLFGAMAGGDHSATMP